MSPAKVRSLQLGAARKHMASRKATVARTRQGQMVVGAMMNVAGVHSSEGQKLAAAALGAQKGKHTARNVVIAGAVGVPVVSAFKSRNGRAVDPAQGRPTGIYGF
jgi:hypothetical protein